MTSAPPRRDAGDPVSRRELRARESAERAGLRGRLSDVLDDPRRVRQLRWGGPALIVVLAAVLRLWNLGHPRALVFDETYYVKDAYTLWHLGYEGAWGDNANPAFEAGDTSGFSTDPAFVAHPPLGKWLIGIGEAALGDGDTVGWRISTAIIGILLVVLTMLIAQKLFRSTIITMLAGGLLAIDGNAIVMSRVSLLDGYVAFFALLGAGAVLLDRDWSERRTLAWIAARDAAERRADWGPTLWWRPWLIAAALAFGAASSTKWSGLYFLAIFAVYSVASDALARRRMGISFWLTSALLKQAPASFVLTVPVTAAVYLASWTGWFVTNGGYYRHWLEDSRAAGTDPSWTGALSWVPIDLQNWWHYQSAIYQYAVNESSPHPYSANPLTWLFLVRPTSMYYESLGDVTTGQSAEAITGIANPLIWWSATAAIGYLVWRLIRQKDWRVGFVLVGLAAGYLPWLLYLHRTTFQFYTIVFEPFLVIGLAVALRQLLSDRGDPRRRVGVIVVTAFVAAAVLLSSFWYPLWTGTEVPVWFQELHYWLRSWK